MVRQSWRVFFNHSVVLMNTHRPKCVTNVFYFGDFHFHLQSNLCLCLYIFIFINYNERKIHHVYIKSLFLLEQLLEKLTNMNDNFR